MTILTDPQKESFRLSMLLNDTRYRSITMQVIALIVLVATFWYLGANLMANLRAQGLNISYEFLGKPAGYDINQTHNVIIQIHRGVCTAHRTHQLIALQNF